MLDINLGKCPKKHQKQYLRLISDIEGSLAYYDGKVVGILKTSHGANAIIIWKNPKFNWYDGVTIYSHEVNGNFVSEGDDLESDIEKRINLYKRFGEGNYEWIRFEN